MNELIATIFTPVENMVGTTMRIIDRIFNKCYGKFFNINKWNFPLRFIKSKSKSKFTWEVEFNLNKDKVNPFEKQKQLREDAKQKFIDNVLMDSNRLRKQSDLLASIKISNA